MVFTCNYEWVSSSNWKLLTLICDIIYITCRYHTNMIIVGSSWNCKPSRSFIYETIPIGSSSSRNLWNNPKRWLRVLIAHTNRVSMHGNVTQFPNLKFHIHTHVTVNTYVSSSSWNLETWNKPEPLIWRGWRSITFQLHRMHMCIECSWCLWSCRSQDPVDFKVVDACVHQLKGSSARFVWYFHLFEGGMYKRIKYISD